MKTKIISENYAESMERSVNKFIKDKKIIDIKFTSWTDYENCGFSAMIIYEEKNNE